MSSNALPAVIWVTAFISLMLTAPGLAVLLLLITAGLVNMWIVHDVTRDSRGAAQW